MEQQVEEYGDLHSGTERPQPALTGATIELNEGDILFAEGDTSDGVYRVVAGVMGVRVRQGDGREAVIDKLGPGAVFGEMARHSGHKRTATVYAVTEACLVRLSEQKDGTLTAEIEQALQETKEVAEVRWQRLQLAQRLQAFLGVIEPIDLHILQEKMPWHHLANGDVLYREGEASNGLYLVVNGRLRVVFSDAHETTGWEVAAGETVGELSVLSGDSQRAATVYAVRGTNVVHISLTLFEELLHRYPRLINKISQLLVGRQKRTLRQAKPTAPTSLSLALIPASPRVDIQQFARELCGALKSFGSVVTLDPRAVDERYGRPGAAQTPNSAPHSTAVALWLNELESQHKFTLLTAEAADTPWTRRCINQADRVLIVGYPQADATPGAAEQYLASLQIRPRTELVLWHERETERPTGTLPWLKARDVCAHHHVRQGDANHMARLARRLTGNAIGLVLSGGGARGLAHLGVYRALQQLRIPVDYIAGTSIGSVIGGGIALFENHDEMLPLVARLANKKTLFDYTLPFTSFFASHKVTNFMKEIYGDVQIEDLWMPFFCVATNMTTVEAVILDRGPLWWAIRASLSIPGIFTPVVAEGEILVDGGVMDNFPAMLLAQRCESERIIGINVKPEKVKKRDYHFETAISGWRILASRLNPFAKKLRTPSLFGVFMRAMELNSVHSAREGLKVVDLLIEPEVKQFSILDFHAYKPIMEIGYETALAPLRVWGGNRLPYLQAA